MGLSFGPSLVVVAQYFDRHRGLANGIAVSGSGVGTFLIPPLYRYLIDTFGLRGGLIVFSSLTLHICVCASLMRPAELYHRSHHHRQKAESAKLIDHGHKHVHYDLPEEDHSSRDNLNYI